MHKNTVFITAGAVCLIASASLFAAFSYFNNAKSIEKLQSQFSNTPYPKNRDILNKDMASILLPKLQKQRQEEEKLGQVKKPDMVFVPEQLRSERGY